MNQSILMKTCSICGIQKPLNAFLEIAGGEGARYSHICADCRKTEAGLKKDKIEVDDGTISSSGRTIDSKTRVASEKDKREQREEIDKNYYDEREETAEKNTNDIEKENLVIREEKKHQDKKQANNFLNRPYTATQVNKKFESLSVEHQNSDAANKAVLSKDENTKQETATKSEEAAKTTDLSSSFAPSQTGSMLKQTGRFQAFVDSLTGASPIKNALGKQQDKTTVHSAEKERSKTVTQSETKQTTQVQKSQDAAATKTRSEKTWGHFSAPVNRSTQNRAPETSAQKTNSIAEKIEQTWGPGKKR